MAMSAHEQRQALRARAVAALQEDAAHFRAVADSYKKVRPRARPRPGTGHALRAAGAGVAI